MAHPCLHQECLLFYPLESVVSMLILHNFVLIDMKRKVKVFVQYTKNVVLYFFGNTAEMINLFFVLSTSFSINWTLVCKNELQSLVYRIIFLKRYCFVFIEVNMM